MFGWFKKKVVESPIVKAMEETKADIVEALSKPEPTIYPKPKHVDCKCYKCLRWEQQNAK